METKTLLLLAMLLLGTAVWSTGAEYIEDYMELTCNKVLTERITGRIETSVALTYDPLMDCTTTITVTPGKRIMLYVKRFDFEDLVDGECLDYFRIRDGDSGSSPILDPDLPICGYQIEDFNVSTSSNSVTLEFHSDATAQFRGFDILYTEFTPVPCAGEDFRCHNNLLCVPPVTLCDNVNQCGDYSDDSDCAIEDLIAEEEEQLNLALIIGCTIAGIVALILIIVAIYKIYEWYKWKRFIKLSEGWRYKEEYVYPVTDKYKIYEVGQRGRRPPEIEWYCVEGPAQINKGESGKYLDEL